MSDKRSDIPQTVPQKSATFTDPINAEIRRAAATGIYDIRGWTDGFSNDYTYFSSFAESMLRHAHEYADASIQRFKLDANSHVVMEPGPRTYMLIYDGPEDRKVLCETENRREIEEKLTEYVAHRIVEHERVLGEAPETPEKPIKNNNLPYFLFWLLGAAMGAAALFGYIHMDSLLEHEFFRMLTTR